MHGLYLVSIHIAHSNNVNHCLKRKEIAMKKDKKKKRNILICVLVGSMLAISIVYYYVDSDPIKSLLLGVISSIIASLIFYVFSVLAFDNGSTEIDELKNITQILSENVTKGVLSIQGRSEYETHFWISFLRETNKRLVLSGRTLNRWLVHEVKSEFAENLKRILDSKGEIILIIYKDLQEEAEKREKEKLRTFLCENIFPLCVKRSKRSKRVQLKKDIKLTIAEVDVLTYLYNENDNKIIVAPYFQHVDNGNNIMFVLKQDCKYGSAYSRDFQSIIDNASKCKWLDEFIEQQNDRGQN